MDNYAKTMAELLTRLNSGDEKAFEEIYNLSYEKAYFTALKVCKNEDDAQDVVQEAYMVLMNEAKNLKNPDAFLSWFNMIVANRAKNLLRKNNPLLFKNEEEEEYVLDSIPDEDSEYIPSEDVEQDELKKDVMELIDSLNDEKRTAVILYYYDEMTTRQIADSLGVNENTVKSRLVQAKKDLAKGVKELEKKNRKLLGIAPVPLIIWALKSTAKGLSVPVLPASTAAGGTAAAETSAAAGRTSAVSGASATKIAGFSLAKKIIAVIAAVGIVAGGIFGVKAVIDKKSGKTDGKISNSVSDTEAETDNEEDYDNSEEIVIEPSEAELYLDAGTPVNNNPGEFVSGAFRYVIWAYYHYYDVTEYRIIITGFDKSTKNVVIPETIAGITVSFIDQNVIKDFSGITSLYLPSGFESINSFYIERVESGISYIDPGRGGSSGFADLEKLKAVAVSSNSELYTSEDGILFNKDMTRLICYPTLKKTASYYIPDTVEIAEIGRSEYLKVLTLGKDLRWLNFDVANSSNFEQFIVSSENSEFGVTPDGALSSASSETYKKTEDGWRHFDENHNIIPYKTSGDSISIAY